MKKIIFICVILSIFLLTPVVMGQPPMPPCVFYGSVYIDGKPAPDGVNVTAVVAGVTVNVTQTVNGTYEAVVLSEQAADGETVQFYVAGNIANQVGIFDSGGAERLDLNATSALRVVIDQSYVSHEEASVNSVQIVGFHAEWSQGGSDVTQGSITVGLVQGSIVGGNITCSLNATGWITFNTTSPNVQETAWVVTAVSCGGVQISTQTAPEASIIWNRIMIVDGGISKDSITPGETVTVWFKAVYEYDNTTFNNGTLYVNDSALSWSTAKNRWEYNFTATTNGTDTFVITGALDNLHSITAPPDDTVGSRTLTVHEQPGTTTLFLYTILAIIIIAAGSAAIFFVHKKRARTESSKRAKQEIASNTRAEHNLKAKKSEDTCIQSDSSTFPSLLPN